MSVGYFIGLGDKTTCGGEVLDGDKRVNIHGLFHACEGDRVTCGKDGQTYKIVGGISHINSHGRLMAGLWPALWIVTATVPVKPS
ncbi:PAAR domain-containing protein [Pseudomonas lactis]|uniref:PAAR domain-containing protein n=1 Tax=Pseudomonas lactis TaxID=1615674 RepID=UPI000B038832|nr:PAAR domain-containing protein [Pseudomonas lactis]